MVPEAHSQEVGKCLCHALIDTKPPILTFLHSRMYHIVKRRKRASVARQFCAIWSPTLPSQKHLSRGQTGYALNTDFHPGIYASNSRGSPGIFFDGISPTHAPIFAGSNHIEFLAPPPGVVLSAKYHAPYIIPALCPFIDCIGERVLGELLS